MDGFRGLAGSAGLAGLFEARPKRLVPVAYQWPPFSGLGAGGGAGTWGGGWKSGGGPGGGAGLGFLDAGSAAAPRSPEPAAEPASPPPASSGRFAAPTAG